MHEYAITENLIEIVSEELKKHNSKKLTTVNLVVGEISSIIPECIELYFEALVRNTELQDAKLKFETIPAELKCSSCGKLFKKTKNKLECPECGEIGVFTDKGKEFYIESIEIEDFKDLK